jgi:hypothetical protein
MSHKIIAVRDGFKDEDGVYWDAFKIAEVSSAHAAYLCSRSSHVMSLDDLKTRITKGYPTGTLAGFARKLKLDDLAHMTSPERDRERRALLAAAILAKIEGIDSGDAPAEELARHAAPASPKKTSKKVKAAAAADGAEAPEVQS